LKGTTTASAVRRSAALTRDDDRGDRGTWFDVDLEGGDADQRFRRAREACANIEAAD
jgi:hypothetical protein